MLEKIGIAIGEFLLGIAVAALGAVVGFIIGSLILFFALTKGLGPYLASFGLEPSPDFMAGIAVFFSILAASIIVPKEAWSRSAKAGCLLFVLAFAIHVLPDRETGHQIDACSGDKSYAQHELNIPPGRHEIAPRLSAPSGYVYLIYDSDHSKLYNFGYTTDIATRMVKINEQVPGTVDLVALLRLEHAADYEHKLRRKYIGSENSDGWFDLTREDLVEICSL